MLCVCVCIVPRFHSLVDYLTSFSGVDFVLDISPKIVFSFFPPPSWQVDRSHSFISGRHVCTNRTATFESQFLFLYPLLYFKSSNVYFLHLCFFNYLQHKLRRRKKKNPVAFSLVQSVRLRAGVMWDTVLGGFLCTSRRGFLYGGGAVSSIR